MSLKTSEPHQSRRKTNDVGGLGKPLEKSPAPSEIQAPRATAGRPCARPRARLEIFGGSPVWAGPPLLRGGPLVRWRTTTATVVNAIFLHKLVSRPFLNTSVVVQHNACIGLQFRRKYGEVLCHSRVTALKEKSPVCLCLSMAKNDALRSLHTLRHGNGQHCAPLCIIRWAAVQELSSMPAQGTTALSVHVVAVCLRLVHADKAA